VGRRAGRLRVRARPGVGRPARGRLSSLLTSRSSTRAAIVPSRPITGRRGLRWALDGRRPRRAARLELAALVDRPLAAAR
jgi:hypothetical protein